MTLPLFPDPPRVLHFTVLVDNLPPRDVRVTIHNGPGDRIPHSAACEAIGATSVGSTSAARLTARIGEHAVWGLAIRTGGRQYSIPLRPADDRWRRIVAITDAILRGGEVSDA